MFCLPSEKGSALKGKNLLLGEQILSFRVDPFQKGLGVQKQKLKITKVVSLSEGFWCAGTDRKSQKLSPMYIMKEKLPSMSIHLKHVHSERYLASSKDPDHSEHLCSFDPLCWRHFCSTYLAYIASI